MHSTRSLLLILSVLAGGLAGCPAAAPPPPEDISTPFGTFTRKTILMGGFGLGAFTQPAFVRFGPDGRLYVSTYTGSLYALTLDAEHQVTGTQVYRPLGSRMLTGIAFDPDSTASHLIVYVGSNQPPTWGAPDLTGKVSRIDGLGSAAAVDLIAPLPRGSAEHMTFALEFGLDGRLYIAQGGNTNNGAAAPGLFENRPESPLSAALLVADVRSPAFRGIEDVEVFAPGLRNNYGLCLHSNGKFYGTDQGSNLGHGGSPNPDGTVTPVDHTMPDEVNVLVAGRYYGHPNPSRGQYAFQAGLPDGTPHQPPVVALPPGVVVTGLAEYTSSANGGLLEGKLLLTGFIDDNLWYVSLTEDGMEATDFGVMAGGFANPLDITVGPDGAIYILEAGGTLRFGGSGPAKLTVLEPHVPPLPATPAGGG